MPKRRAPRKRSSSIMRAVARAEPRMIRRMLEERVLALLMDSDSDDNSEALRFVDAVIERYGPDSVGPEILAFAYGFSGRTEEAFRLIESFREGDPTDGCGLLVHAGLLRREERFEECAAVLREAVAYYPDQPSFHLMLAWWGADGISDKAMRFHYERALELDPDGYGPHMAGIAYWKRVGEPDEARPHREFLRDNHPDAYARVLAEEAEEAGEVESESAPNESTPNGPANDDSAEQA
ncbi:hypothetical protein SAMN05216298_0555 [Glycomyces sambucus]|uniref:Tetratricopeptide repeat-containing protein n=1 Tax=Glycomyces sambucus TaxID=380244 RepID=A0A1G9CX09_9ACTN|nr:hypothetical protein [Glycomyces sambucus]SDK56207.1 hypothetical protein SAMN05216298_0555 [Glycomyces sambucus]